MRGVAGACVADASSLKPQARRSSCSTCLSLSSCSKERRSHARRTLDLITVLTASISPVGRCRATRTTPNL